MNSIFSLDSTFMKYANKFADLMFLNIIAVIFCIPIFTIGAAMTAMHTMLLKIYRDEESYVIRGFIKAFKENFKQATIIWLIYLLFGLVLALDFFYMRNYSLDLPKVLNYALIFVGVMGAFCLAWVFILQSRYENKVFTTIKNAFIVGTSHFLYSIIMIILSAAPVFVAYFFPVTVPICLSVGMTLPGVLQAMLYSKVFDRLEGIDRKALKAQPMEDDGWTVDEIEETLQEEAVLDVQVDEEKVD